MTREHASIMQNIALNHVTFVVFKYLQIEINTIDFSSRPAMNTFFLNTLHFIAHIFASRSVVLGGSCSLKSLLLHFSAQ